MIKNKRNYVLKIKIKRIQVDSIRTHSIRPFYTHLRNVIWGNDISVYLRVSYGKHVDNRGNVVTFYNDGEYDNRKDFELALTAFLEE